MCACLCGGVGAERKPLSENYKLKHLQNLFSSMIKRHIKNPVMESTNGLCPKFKT